MTCKHSIVFSSVYRAAALVRMKSRPSSCASCSSESRSAVQLAHPPVTVSRVSHGIRYGCVHVSVRLLCSRYYSIYDSGDRQSLLDAYHDGASLSMMTPYSTQNPSRYKVTVACFDSDKMYVVRPGT